MTTVNIDNQEYEYESLSDAARQQLANLQVTDEEIGRLQTKLAIAHTARAAYAAALHSELAQAKQ